MNKKFQIITITILLLIIAGLSAYLIYLNLNDNKQSQNLNQNPLPAPEPKPDPNPNPEPEPEPEPTPEPEPSPEPQIKKRNFTIGSESTQNIFYCFKENDGTYESVNASDGNITYNATFGDINGIEASVKINVNGIEIYNGQKVNPAVNAFTYKDYYIFNITSCDDRQNIEYYIYDKNMNFFMDRKNEYVKKYICTFDGDYINETYGTLNGQTDCITYQHSEYKYFERKTKYAIENGVLMDKDSSVLYCK